MHQQNLVPGLASRILQRRIRRASGFFMRDAQHTFYGGLCGGTERCAGSFVAGYANPAQFTTIRLASDVVINRYYKGDPMNTKPSVFSFESNAEIRTIIIDGNPWFIALDVCHALGISNNRDAMLKLDDDEKNTVALTDGNRGNPNTLVISESGLYTLILRCRDAVTPGTIPYRFRKWVTSEVLPQIRRTGRYVREELSPADKAQKVVASFMPAILEAMKTESHHTYDYPLKPGYRDFIHSPEGVVGLAEYSMLMNMLRQMEEDGHDVSGAAAEFTTMVNYIVGASKCLRDIQTHAQFINKSAGEF